MLKHILLVDDDEDEHLFFQWSLEKIPLTIQLLDAFSSNQAQEVVGQVIPDVIFVDINLPGADGFECLESLKKNAGIENIPVYMYSTDISERSREKAAQLGAAGCMKKCRNHDILAKSIYELLITSVNKAPANNVLAG